MFNIKSLLTFALLAFCILSSGGCSKKQKGGGITEAQVSSFMEELDRAEKNHDVDAIVALMSEDVRVNITAEGFGPAQNLAFNRDQFKAHSKQSLGMTNLMDYRRGDTAIKVQPDGQSAFVSAEKFKTYTINQQTAGSVTKVSLNLEVEDGKLVITRSDEVSRPLPAEKKKARPGSFF